MKRAALVVLAALGGAPAVPSAAEAPVVSDLKPDERVVSHE